MRFYKESHLFIVDIDKFKSINDTYGHNVGDEVLKLVSASMIDSVGKKDLLCRWGGDEFVGVIYGTREEAEKSMNTIVEKIYSAKANEKYKVTISMGAAKIHRRSDLLKVLSEADKALYSVKEDGRNGIRIVD